VLQTPGMFEYFLSMAHQLNEWGQFSLAFLELDGRPIAFEYGWFAKGVYHSLKVGYDEQYAQYSPGQLLVAHILEHFHRNHSCHRFDCLGPLTDSMSKWTDRTYVLSRLTLAPRGLGRIPVLLRNYKNKSASVAKAFLAV